MKRNFVLFLLSVFSVVVFGQTTTITSFEDDFEDGVIWSGWDTAARSHTLTEAGGMLTIAVDKPTDVEKWDGISMGFGTDTLMNLTKNMGLFSVDLKADADCKVDISIFDTTGAYNPGMNQLDLVGGADWVTMEFEYMGGNLLRLKWNGDTLDTVDVAIADHLLLTFNGGSAWTGNVMMDNLKLGDAAFGKIVSFEDDFEDGELWAGWDTAARSHTLTEAGGMLTIAVDKPTDAEKWDGITMGFLKDLIDLTPSGGLFSVKLKADADCKVDIAAWDITGTYNPGRNTMNLIGGEDWVTLEFEYEGANLLRLKWNGDTLGIVDASQVKHLLMTFNGGSAWTGNVMMDDLKMGNAAYKKITSFSDDFEDGDLWAGWDTAARSHTLTEAGGILTIAVDKPTDAEKWDGLTMNFGNGTLLDLTENAGFSVKLKADADCKVDISVHDITGQYNPGRNQINLVGGEDWATMTFEYAGDNLLRLKWNGDTLGMVDNTIIDYLLLTFNGGSAWTGTVMMDDLTLGSTVQSKITSFTDDFEDGEIWEGWDTEARSHILTEADGILTIAVDKPTDAEKWDGLTMGFGAGTLLDLSAEGGFSAKLKADADCKVDISAHDTTGQYNPGLNAIELVGGEDWVTLTFDYSGDNLIHFKWNGDTLGVVDNTIIDYLLLTFNGGSAWTGNVMMDDLAIGQEVVVFSDDATLASLALTGYELDPAFDAAVTSYHIEAEADADLTGIVDAVANDDNASVDITLPGAIPGDITIEVTAEDGSVNTYTIAVSELVSVENNFQNLVRVYPNPVNDYLMIESKTEIQQLNIYTATGQLAHSDMVAAGKYRLNVSHFERGVYIVSMQFADGSRGLYKYIKR